LWIDPPAAPGPGRRDVELTIRLGGAGLSDVRLYQDNVGVRSGQDFEPLAAGRALRARVWLHAGVNRFFAMASRDGSVDGRSADVTLRYDGETPGRLHVLALGVSRYAHRPLRFADADASQIADYLHGHGLGDPDDPGFKHVLTNDKVSPESVADAFRRLREKVRRRPEDTLVLFIAGHTGVVGGQFCLFLPKYPFPEQGGPREPAAPEDPNVLPYAEIYRKLAPLDCLRRLVVIDACHSEAVLDDVAVRRVQEFVERGAHEARTSYILAARPDDPANEVEALGHGLLTYVLLRGMGDTHLKEVPDPSIFDPLRTADLDRDRRVTTGELRDYAAAVLPRLVTQFPELVSREGDPRRPGDPKPGAGPARDPRLRTSTTSFPLVELGPSGADNAPTPAAPQAPR
jgi:hypothetical protein